MEAAPLRAYLVDDEPLAIERLKRLLAGFDNLEIVATATDPAQALADLNAQSAAPIDVLFLDIQMPGINGFDLLARLTVQPFVIFTTAYDEYALRAFEVNSIDYLVKPIETAQLARALKKLGRLRPVPKPASRATRCFAAQPAARLSASHRLARR
jgi:two-component system LytT family response regulator